ncbi:MAG TPA: GIY-YIG nuclease family protein [Candidatus Woesebacteria bacterium]|nr:GIY-YIG nuclease family protein [Candidatus Woesebacteria bacterium]
MYEVYVLKSDCVDWFYVGMSSNTDKRLSQHNSGRVKSTKSKKPLKIIFTKKFGTRIQARDFEKYLKVRSNKEKLLRTLKYL